MRTLCFSGLAICLVAMSWNSMKPYPGSPEIIQQRHLLGSDDDLIDDDDCLALHPNMTVDAHDDYISEFCTKKDEMCKETCCASGASSTQFFTLEPFGGMFFLHIFIMFYMFQGIAIVCDEQFVPALEVISERLELSNDIAGATLMAAGGSAPELATNLIASVFSGSDVGFGAIVGSAVFNVLFVIGVCAIATPKHLLPLQLTWWPLFRDCTYYIISLLSLYIFFQVVSPWKVYWYEALIQFLLYLGYVLLMAYSETLEAMVKKRLEKNSSAVIDVKPAATEEDTDSNVEFERPSTFRVGILELLEKGTSSLADKASYAAIAKIQGDADETFDKIDTNASGTIEQDELKAFMSSFTKVTTSELDDTTIANLCKELASQSEGDTISREDFKKWYMTSEGRMTNEIKKTFDKVDVNKSGTISKSAIKDMLSGLGHKADESQIAEAEELIKGNGEEISFEDFQKWYQNSLFWNKKTAVAEAAAEDEEGSSMWEAVMEGCAGLSDKEKPMSEKLVFLFNLPLMTALSVLPNCQAEGMGGWSYFVFFGSIVYIGIFCALMVDSAVVIGYMLCIPDVVMGMVFLAAGTSVPDLISSVIVAKQGEGDMAVSSSVGSNIFDVCFGLPVPWFIMNLVYGNCGVTVTAKNLPLSLGLLLGMVFVVVAAIGISGWKMSHELGYFFFACYFIYLLQDVIQVFTVYADELAPTNPEC